MTAHRRWSHFGTLGVLALLAGSGCGDVGGPRTWNSQEVQLSVHYDTIPGGVQADSLPLRVQYDTVRNSAGYPLLWVTVSAQNLSDRPLIGTTDGCSWLFAAYDAPARDGSPLWSESLEALCTSDAWAVALEAGATQTFPRRSLEFDSIVAGGGPGTYYFAARLRGRVGDAPIGWLTNWIPAGSIELVP